MLSALSFPKRRTVKGEGCRRSKVVESQKHTTPPSPSSPSRAHSLSLSLALSHSVSLSRFLILCPSLFLPPTRARGYLCDSAGAQPCPTGRKEGETGGHKSMKVLSPPSRWAHEHEGFKSPPSRWAHKHEGFKSPPPGGHINMRF